MHGNQKFFNKLNDREKARVLDAFHAIRTGTLEGFDVKKIKGWKDLFRIRMGRIRIVFTRDENDTKFVRWMGYRDDNTYREF